MTDLNISIATVTIRGTSPLSQSRNHNEPSLDGESHEDKDKRTWRSKLNVGPAGTVVIPQHGFLLALSAAAKYSGKQIPGQGKKTWTAKFTTGIMIPDDIDTGIDPATVGMIEISANSDGVRGSGKRVLRRFPIMPEWQATFEVWILDPIITEPVFREMVGLAGLFIGLGRFRPEKGGSNGRFKLTALDWQDNRQPVAA